MERKYVLPLILIANQPAYAHMLEGQDGLLTRLFHQLAGTHHLPLSLALIAVGVLVVRGWRTRMKRTATVTNPPGNATERPIR